MEHTARAPGGLPPLHPSPSTPLPTPAGDGHGRRLYVAPPAVGIAASPGGYTLHPEHPDFSPHRTRVSSSSASSNHPCLYLAESAASVVLGDPGAVRRGECIPRGAAEAVRVLSLSLLVVKFTCAHLCGCFWIVVLTNVIVRVISLALLWHCSIAVGGIEKLVDWGNFITER